MAAPMGLAPPREPTAAVSCVDDIRPGAGGSIHVCGGGGGRPISAVHTFAEHVYIYENDTRKVGAKVSQDVV